ncbi:MAG: MobA/MobL family protein, partial [Lachnospiraceae bacterium]|nr:MobA/MobL family protein [Lachnospiraceae bacterium]
GKYVFNAVKTTDWSEVETLNTWRENWAKCINEAFESKGIPVRVDHRSFEERGEDFLPQIHEGPNVRAMEKRGIKTDKGDWNRFVKWVNNQIKSLKNLINSISETYKEIKTENEKSQIGFNELIAAIDNYCNSLEKRYGKVRAVKDRTEVNNFIEKYKVSSLDDFNAVTKTLYSKVSDIQNQVKASDAEMKEINDTLGDYKDFKELKPVYDEWYSIKR